MPLQAPALQRSLPCRAGANEAAEGSCLGRTRLRCFCPLGSHGDPSWGHLLARGALHGPGLPLNQSWNTTLEEQPTGCPRNCAAHVPKELLTWHQREGLTASLRPLLGGERLQAATRKATKTRSNGGGAAGNRLSSAGPWPGRAGTFPGAGAGTGGAGDWGSRRLGSGGESVPEHLDPHPRPREHHR